MNGMADEDENNLSDDEWDIPQDQLDVLEQNAIISTQQQQKPQATTRGTVNQPDKLNLSFTQRLETSYTPDQSLQNQGSADPAHQNDQQIVPEDSFEGTIIDEDGLPLIVEDSSTFVPQRLEETVQREQWRINRYGQPNNIPLPTIRQDPIPVARQTKQRPLASQQQIHKRPEVASATGHTGLADREATLAIIEQLRKEKNKLAEDLKKTETDLWTSQGEIKNLRSNQVKDSKAFDRQLDLQKKQMQEEIAKHRASLQSKTKENEKLMTAHSYLQHELDEQVQKVGILQRKAQERSLRDKPNEIDTTPKRGLVNSLRDGFDDDEVMMVSPTKSPSKSGRKSKVGTPTANRKRKQGATNDASIPTLALRLSGSAGQEVDEAAPTEAKQEKIVRIVRKDNVTARHLRLVQDVLNFYPEGSHESLIERFVGFSFSSEATKSFSSLILEATSKLAGKRIPGDLLQVFIDLWKRSIHEQYHKPLKLLAQIIKFILEKDPYVVDADIIINILLPLQMTAHINAQKRFMQKSTTQIWTESEKKPELDTEIDTTSCLRLLHTIALLVSDDLDLLGIFWRSMSTDYVLLLLSSSQLVSDISIMLEMLSTSIFPTTFGNICVPEEQLRMETYIIDRVVFLLWEQFKPDPNQPPYSRKTICELRLDALSLLTRFGQTTSSPHPHTHRPSIAKHHGTTFLTNHPTAIARLVRSIYDEVDNLYCLYPATHTLHARLVNSAVNILHHILTSPQAETLDLAAKLQGTICGTHKFRVALTRLAFREAGFLDAGVTDETVRKATELLEENVTPDEAVELLEAFGRDVGGAM